MVLFSLSSLHAISGAQILLLVQRVTAAVAAAAVAEALMEKVQSFIGLHVEVFRWQKIVS